VSQPSTPPLPTVPADAVAQPTRPSPPEDRLSRYQRADILLKQLTLAAQCVGFIILGWGLYVNSKATGNSTVANLSTWMFEIDREFVRSPNMTPYFSEDKEIAEKDPDHGKAMALAALHADVMDSMLSMRGYPPHEGWDIWMKERFQRSPILRRYLSENKQYYPVLWPKFQGWDQERKGGK
jgi:hypothetical protein